MNVLTQEDLLKAGVHLGHLSRKWNPKMAPFIFMESRGIHIIDLNKTLVQLQEASNALQNIAKAGKKILFVATKKQARDLVAQLAQSFNMPYMTERWLGGTLTNFITIRKLIKKLTSMDRMIKSVSYKNMAKKEQLMIARNKAKLERVLVGVLDLTRLPGALVVVDVVKESIAIGEANKLGIPLIALVDTNADPDLVDYPIASNDDATPAIELLLRALGDAIATGLTMREESKALEEQERESKEQHEQHQQHAEGPQSQGYRPRGVKKVTYTEADLEEAAAYDAAQKAAKSKLTDGVGRLRRTKLKDTVPVKQGQVLDTNDSTKDNKPKKDLVKAVKPLSTVTQPAVAVDEQVVEKKPTQTLQPDAEQESKQVVKATTRAKTKKTEPAV